MLSDSAGLTIPKSGAKRTVPLIRPDLPTLEEIAGPLRDMLASGKVTNFGRYVTEFEERAGAYLGTQVATVSSGTMGLLLTLQALGLQRGQKVILPSFTFMATAQAVLYAGAEPLFAEVRDDLTLCPADLANLLAKHPEASMVIPVHTYGLPCCVEEIQEVADEAARRRAQPISVVYDAAHAFGSAVDGKRVGGFGNAEIFSLSVTKVLVSVEGGMVSSRDSDLIRRLKKMRNYGVEENYDAHWPGLNGKMSEMHAVVGLHNLNRLDELVAVRQRRARYFIERVQAETSFGLLPWPDGVVHTFKDFTVLVPAAMRERRGAVMAFLKERGVETRAYFFPPVHEQKFFRRFADRPLPVTESLSRRVITLPFYSSITEDEIDYMVEALVEVERRVS